MGFPSRDAADGDSASEEAGCFEAFVGELMRLLSKARRKAVPHICSSGGVSGGSWLTDF